MHFKSHFFVIIFNVGWKFLHNIPVVHCAMCSVHSLSGEKLFLFSVMHLSMTSKNVIVWKHVLFNHKRTHKHAHWEGSRNKAGNDPHAKFASVENCLIVFLNYIFKDFVWLQIYFLLGNWSHTDIKPDILKSKEVSNKQLKLINFVDLKLLPKKSFR